MIESICAFLDIFKDQPYLLFIVIPAMILLVIVMWIIIYSFDNYEKKK